MLYHKMLRCEGTDEWVVLIHGAGGSSNVWFKQIREYSKYFNVLLIDLHQQKQANMLSKMSKLSFQDVTSAIINILDQYKLKQSHFVGLSMGTIIIRELAEVAPQYIKSMTLAGAVIKLDFKSRFLSRGADRVKNILPYRWLYRIYAYMLMPNPRHKNSRIMFINEALKIRRDEFIKWMELNADLDKILNFFWQREIPIPAHYIMGEDDYVFLSQVKLFITKNNKYSKLSVIPDAGHVCNIDQSDIFNDVSVRFIKNIAKTDQSAHKETFTKTLSQYA